MNPQQLQTARAALWHQTAPLLTADEATTWLGDLGLCLFLPRHAQLPAPAPSFVEAVHGSASAAPPAAALAHATELAMRLVDERRAVPLNLLGTYSEQADFLITPEVLPWVAAVRGDRQWNAAPGGRSAPLVVRTWEVLDREGEATAVQLRGLLGRELTEAAVLRALVELWTTVRAMPVYEAGAPTRWTLLKNRFPAQLTTGANTAQTTALSALLSIYLRSAVAATAEEAEVFLSPLTARSRIREVIHGMMAARQFGSMSVSSKTLLFVEGSLPEDLPVEEETTIAAAPATGEKVRRTPKPPFRKEFPDKRRPSRPAGELRRGPRPSFGNRPEKREGAKPWQRRPAFGGPERPAREERPAAESRPPRGEQRPSTGFRPAARGENRPGGKPWQRRPAFRGPERPPREERPAAAAHPTPGSEKRPSTGFRPAARGENRQGAKPWQRRPAFGGPDRPARAERPSDESRPGPRDEKRPPTGFRPAARDEKRPGAKPWQRRPAAGSSDRGGERRRPFEREGAERRPRPASERRPGQRFGQRTGQKPSFRPSGPKSFERKAPGAKPFTGPRPKFPPKREDRSGPAGSADRRPPRFGKPQRREGSGRPVTKAGRFKPRTNKNFRKPGLNKENPRKNRTQEEKPE
ncbi:MAG: hypothetical protein WB622_08780 [Acidobacteriaceae bacterium]